MDNGLPSKMGRPKIEIEEEAFIKLCGIQCTLYEIAAWFSCSEDTIQRWCLRNFEETFAVVYKRYSSAGRSSLRRWLWHSAESGNTTMQIWLSKQHLDMKDEPNATPPPQDKKEYIVLWQDDEPTSISQDEAQDASTEASTSIDSKV